MPKRVLVEVLVVLLLMAGIGFAADQPIAVSPGDESKLAAISNPCPTFIWGAVPEAEAYDLVVYRADQSMKEVEPILRQEIAGSALGWTPSLDLCLERGRRYVWSVRAISRGKASGWSAPNLFEVTPGPSDEEFQAALELVQNYLAAREVSTVSAPADGVVTRFRGSPASREDLPTLAPSPGTQLSVDGNVDATSFSGDGSLVANLTPANLSAGTAGIDISGTAASASDVVCTDCVSGSELAFDPATQTELNSHTVGNPNAHHLPPTTLPPTGTAGGDLTGVYPNPTVGPGAVGSVEIVDGSITGGDLAFDPATQTELNSHTVGNPNAHHLPPTTLPPTGTAGGDLTGVYPNPTVGPGAVGSTEIVDGSVAEGDLAFDPATQSELDGAFAPGSTDLAKLALCDGVPGGWRYWDLGDGTVLDCNTRKIWLKDASCLGQGTWGKSVTAGTVQKKVADLNAGTDFRCSEYTAGTYTDWEVPAVEDLCGQWDGNCGGSSCCTPSAGIVDTTFSDPVVANAEGNAKWSAGDAFVGVQSSEYYSAEEFIAGIPMHVKLNTGHVGVIGNASSLYVWPVRAGQ